MRRLPWAHVGYQDRDVRLTRGTMGVWRFPYQSRVNTLPETSGQAPFYLDAVKVSKCQHGVLPWLSGQSGRAAR
jgi:hypothetical protein